MLHCTCIAKDQSTLQRSASDAAQRDAMMLAEVIMFNGTQIFCDSMPAMVYQEVN